MAGFPRAARAVGNVLRTCDDPSIPAHRVTGANGALGGFGSSPLVKRQLLIAEGITLRGQRLREFKRIRWVGKAAGRGKTKAVAASAKKAAKARPPRS